MRLSGIIIAFLLSCAVFVNVVLNQPHQSNQASVEASGVKPNQSSNGNDGKEQYAGAIRGG
jgi:MFS superfamily sulfate permease-like transporter